MVGWFNDQVRKFKNRNNRSATGAYEAPLQDGGAGAQRRGFGPLDPDEAWDARVGNEAEQYGYYEEREMGGGPRGAPAPGAHDNTEYSGASYSMNLAGPYGRAGGDDDDDDGERGRKPRTTHAGGVGRNPFDDDMASSMRGVSPRPMEGGGGAGEGGRGSLEGRRSAFREDV